MAIATDVSTFYSALSAAQSDPDGLKAEVLGLSAADRETLAGQVSRLIPKLQHLLLTAQQSRP